MKTVILIRLVISTESGQPEPSAVAHALEDALNDRTWKKVGIGMVGHDDMYINMYIDEAHLVAYHPKES